MAALAYSPTDADRPMATVGERMPGASASGILDAGCGSTGRGLAAVFRASATIKLMAASLLRTSSALRYTPKDTVRQRLLGRATRSNFEAWTMHLVRGAVRERRKVHVAAHSAR